jgi:hypothetical protein
MLNMGNIRLSLRHRIVNTRNGKQCHFTNLVAFPLIFQTNIFPLFSVADPHHFDANPDVDPGFHFYANPDPDPIFHSDVDSDPDPNTHFIPDFYSPMLQNDPPRLPPFHMDADPDPTLHFEADPASLNVADPDPQHCLCLPGPAGSYLGDITII